MDVRSSWRTNRSELRLEKPLVDRAGELRRRVNHVDDVVELRPKPGRCARSPTLFGRVESLATNELQRSLKQLVMQCTDC
jgi:hypothetical protein